MENNALQPYKPWYKKFWGVVLLIILVLVVITVLLFGGFFVYYAWELKYGDAAGLAEQFTEVKFTVDESLSEQIDSAVIKNMDQYVRDYNPVFGNQEGAITILAFTDFECPFCRQAHSEFKTIMEKYKPVIKVVFKNLPLESIHPWSVPAALAAACAHEQASFWPYHDLLFGQKNLDNAVLLNYASQLGLEEESFNLCFSQGKYQRQINQDVLDAMELGVRDTPTYFVNGFKMEGVFDKKVWDKIILEFLN